MIRTAKFLTVSVALVLTGVGGSGLSAQPSAASPAPSDSSHRLIRVGIGGGAGTMESGNGSLAGRLAVTISTGERAALTFRTASVVEFVLFGPTPAESVSDIGVLYGRGVRGKWGYATASAGLALVSGMRRGARISPPYQCNGDPFGCLFGAMFSTVEHEERPFHTVGVPLELEAGFTFFRVLGVQTTAWADLNGERSMTGLTLGLVLGRLR